MSVNASTSKPAYRKFGVVYHHFPEMTRTEKRFIVLFLACGVVMTFLTCGGALAPESYIVRFCASIIGGVLCYRAKHEPAAFLNLLLFPFTGWSVRWPRRVILRARFRRSRFLR